MKECAKAIVAVGLSFTAALSPTKIVRNTTNHLGTRWVFVGWLRPTQRAAKIATAALNGIGAGQMFGGRDDNAWPVFIYEKESRRGKAILDRAFRNAPHLWWSPPKR